MYFKDCLRIPVSSKVKLVLVLFIAASGHLSFAQNAPYSLTKVIAPSPTAAALGAYGNIEMGYYSGIPNISVPLYEIKTPSNMLSISMSYNASGTKVSENASWVGLGWSLNAGGVITKTTRGIDDFGSNGYYYSPAIPAEANPPLAENQPYFREMSLNRYDGDADIINYNIGPYSGKFVLGKLANGSKVFMDERNNLKVEYLPSKWIITDSKGYKFYLGTQERATDYSYGNTSVEVSDDAPLSAFTKSTDPDVTTAWYLDSISSPMKETIRFIYETTSRVSLSLISKSEEKHKLIGVSGTVCPNNTIPIRDFVETYGASRQQIYNRNLKQIVFNGGTIDFVLTDREDIGYTGALKPAKLDEIIVKNESGIQIQRYKFKYSYFISASTAGRLKLDEVQEIALNNQTKPPYRFTYFEPENVPVKYTKSIDHWNYYNQKSNTSILPSMQNGATYLAGGDRRPDSVSVYPKKGVLSSITYPTGGVTTFDFELNDYSNLTGEDAFADVYQSFEINARPTDESAHSSKTFIIKPRKADESVNVTFSYGYRKYDENANSLKNIQTTFVYLYGPNNVPLNSWSNWPCSGNTQDPTCGMEDGTMQTRQMLLPAGTYRLEVRYLQGYSTSANANWVDQAPVAKRKGAGLRVKSIINSENGNQTLIRKFDYTSDGKTTGKLLSQPMYSYIYSVGGGTTDGQCGITATYVGRISGNIYLPGLLSRGTLVGYSKVTEILGANGEGGKTEYFYQNSEDLYNIIPFLPSISSPYNGKLALKLDYNSAATLVKKKTYEYVTKEQEYLKGVRIFTPPLLQDGSQNSFNIKYYDNISYWTVLSAEGQTDYMNGVAKLTATTKYFYDNPIHKEVTKVEMSNSESGVTTTEYKYPQDVTLSGTAEVARQALIADWRISTVLQQNVIKNGKVQTTKTDYLKANLTLPFLIKSNTGAGNADEIRMQFNSYDSRGNLLDQSPNSGPHTSYRWTSKSQFPVAEVKNAKAANIFYEDFEEGSGNSTDGDRKTGHYSHIGAYNKTLTGLDNGSYVLSFYKKVGVDWQWVTTDITVTSGSYTIGINAQVDEIRFYPKDSEMTNYAYDQLIGMTSETDAKGMTTYYEYDEFQRLKVIKDFKGNIIKSFKYNYKQ